MKTIRLVLCVALVCSIAVAHAAADERKYKIGQAGGFPPFVIVPLAEGVDLDILTALCDVNTNMTCNLKALTSTDCVDTDEAGNQITGRALVEGRVDGCMGWFNTLTRKQLGMEFGEPYSRGPTPQLIALDGDTRFDTLDTEVEINDVTIGFLKGFFNDPGCLNTRYGGNFGAEFFPGDQVGREDLVAALGGDIALIFWDNIDTPLPEGTHSVGERIEGCGPALSMATYPPSKRRKRKSDNLRRDYNCGLALIRENGKLQEICDSWKAREFNPACILEGPLPTVQCVEENLADHSHKGKVHDD